ERRLYSYGKKLSTHAVALTHAAFLFPPAISIIFCFHRYSHTTIYNHLRLKSPQYKAAINNNAQKC
ncbi:hypothetical protein, partial [Photobacterium phosphoreum]|uniref:hypothetical protein n=1 Tax=Photobacterium phosphoreum TaxID=659 RepID=UPI002092C837